MRMVRPCAGDPVEQVVQRLLLAGVEARGGFVEQQHGRVRRQRAGDLDQALMAVGEARNGLVGAVPEPDEIERGAGAALQRRRGRASTSVLPSRSAPIMTFSSAVIERNRRMFWNVRASPAMVRLCAGSAVTSTPSTRIPPAVAR